MKILRYGNRKQDDMFWDASTPEKERAALRRLFEFIDETWQVYSIEDESDTKEQKELEEVAACLKAGWFPAALRREAEEKVKRLEELKKENARHTTHADLYKKAKAGDDDALRRLLLYRKKYEYEEWEWVVAEDPFKE
jgi:hypothetical protein